MDYLQATKRFDFDKYLIKLSGQDLGPIIINTQQEYEVCVKINIGSRGQYFKDIRDLKINYLSYLGGLIFFLKNGLKPYGVKDEAFIKFRPICEELVKKKQLNKAILDLFD